MVIKTEKIRTDFKTLAHLCEFCSFSHIILITQPITTSLQTIENKNKYPNNLSKSMVVIFYLAVYPKQVFMMKKNI